MGLDEKTREIVEQEIKRGKPAIEIVHIHLRDCISKMQDKYTSPSDDLVDVRDVACWLGCSQKQASEWLVNRGVKVSVRSGGNAWYSRDEVSKAYCASYLKPSEPERLAPAFENRISNIQYPNRDVSIRQMLSDFLQTQNQNLLWSAIELLSKHQMKKAGYRKSDDDYEDVLHDSIITMLRAYMQWCSNNNQDKDNADMLMRYLLKTSRTVSRHRSKENNHRKYLRLLSQKWYGARNIC